MSCFFDPMHGQAGEQVNWQPPYGVPRVIPVCMPCAGRVRYEQPQQSGVRGAGLGGHGGAIAAGAGGLAVGALGGYAVSELMDDDDKDSSNESYDSDDDDF